MKKQLLLGLVLLGGMSGLHGKLTWIEEVLNGKKKVKAVMTVNPEYKTKKVYLWERAPFVDPKKDLKNLSHICGPVCMKQKGFPYPIFWFPAGGWKGSLSKEKNKAKNNGKPSGCVCANMLHKSMVVKYLDSKVTPNDQASCFEMTQKYLDFIKRNNPRLDGEFLKEEACSKMAQEKGGINQWHWEITATGPRNQHGGRSFRESIYNTASLNCCMYFKN